MEKKPKNIAITFHQLSFLLMQTLSVFNMTKSASDIKYCNILCLSHTGYWLWKNRSDSWFQSFKYTFLIWLEKNVSLVKFVVSSWLKLFVWVELKWDSWSMDQVRSIGNWALTTSFFWLKSGRSLLVHEQMDKSRRGKWKSTVSPSSLSPLHQMWRFDRMRFLQSVMQFFNFSS